MTDADPPALSPDLSCEAALRAIVNQCADALDAELAVFLCSEDPRGPHKARVALRRLTTALDAFAPLLRRKGAARLRREAKALFRALGAVRDADVHTADRADSPGHDDRVRRTLALRAQTRAALREGGAVTYAPRLRSAVAEGSELFRRGESRLRAAPIAALAGAALGARWEECRRFGADLGALPPEGRHEFRKEMKALRYLAEFFSALFPALGDEPFRSDFRTLQDALGTLNDYEVALALEGRKPPARLPAREARALAEAEAVWRSLRTGPRPWRTATAGDTADGTAREG